MADNFDSFLEDVPHNKRKEKFPETGQNFSSVVEKIVNWRSLCPYFGLTSAEEQEIVGDNVHSVANQKIAFLRRWRNKNYPPTYVALARQFHSAKKYEMVEFVLDFIRTQDGGGGGGGGGGRGAVGGASVTNKSGTKRGDKPTLLLLTAFPKPGGGYMNVFQRIGYKYKKFGRHLLNDEDDSIMSSISKQCQNDPEEALDKAVSRWLRGSSQCSWSDVIECLRKIGDNALADELEQLLL